MSYVQYTSRVISGGEALGKPSDLILPIGGVITALKHASWSSSLDYGSSCLVCVGHHHMNEKQVETEHVWIFWLLTPQTPFHALWARCSG